MAVEGRRIAAACTERDLGVELPSVSSFGQDTRRRALRAVAERGRLPRRRPRDRGGLRLHTARSAARRDRDPRGTAASNSSVGRVSRVVSAASAPMPGWLGSPVCANANHAARRSALSASARASAPTASPQPSRSKVPNVNGTSTACAAPIAGCLPVEPVHVGRVRRRAACASATRNAGTRNTASVRAASQISRGRTFGVVASVRGEHRVGIDVPPPSRASMRSEPGVVEVARAWIGEEPELVARVPDHEVDVVRASGLEAADRVEVDERVVERAGGTASARSRGRARRTRRSARRAARRPARPAARSMSSGSTSSCARETRRGPGARGRR